MKRIILSLLAVALMPGAAAHAATIQVTSATPTLDGAVVVIDLINDGDSDPFYQLELRHSLGVGSASWMLNEDSRFIAWAPAFCNPNTNVCVGANGCCQWVEVIPSSTSTFNITGVGPGVRIHFDFNATFVGNAEIPPAFSVTTIPEPTTCALLGLGLIALSLAGRRCTQRVQPVG